VECIEDLRPEFSTLEEFLVLPWRLESVLDSFKARLEKPSWDLMPEQNSSSLSLASASRSKRLIMARSKASFAFDPFLMRNLFRLF